MQYTDTVCSSVSSLPQKDGFEVEFEAVTDDTGKLKAQGEFPSP